MWYKKWFSDRLYLDLYSHRNTEEAGHMIDLIQRNIDIRTGLKVLDVACGAGRHSMQLAKRGFQVTGFDLSEFLISEAKKSRKEAKENNLKINFLIKDMRNFNFKNSFDLAVNIFTSFGYFDNDEENFRVIKNISSSLKKGGYFVFDFINSAYIKKNIVPLSKNKIGGISVIQKRKIEYGFIIKNIEVYKGRNVRRFKEILKLYSKKELINCFEKFNFKVKMLFGDYYGSKFSEKNSKRIIIIAQKI
ncbi:MAG TPA: class I SAM-dependent methyltransferase [Ignavibacteria bacterium]|nr:class I SAM-dependent methyltransferase [Ignavibacteria bacterium]HRK00871.1 class I SAM-dependent methyltransferase [Ignavibacteria bacterium]